MWGGCGKRRTGEPPLAYSLHWLRRASQALCPVACDPSAAAAPRADGTNGCHPITAPVLSHTSLQPVPALARNVPRTAQPVAAEPGLGLGASISKSQAWAAKQAPVRRKAYRGVGMATLACGHSPFPAPPWPVEGRVSFLGGSCTWFELDPGSVPSVPSAKGCGCSPAQKLSSSRETCGPGSLE